MLGKPIWNAGDWVTFELKVGQIKEIRDGDCVTFSDGFFATSGMLMPRFRPLTLRSKAIVETFHIYYDRLHEIDGEAGFNYPDIYTYFANLALDAIDTTEAEMKCHNLASDFISEARKYTGFINGVRLFRPKRNLAS